MWLRGLLKLAAVILVAGAGGTALGIAIAALTGDDGPPSVATEARTDTAKRAETADVTTSAPAPPTTTPASSDQDLLKQVRVTVGRAVLHPARTPSGRARQRARLGVRVTVINNGAERVVLARPSLLAARQRIPSNAAADAPATRLEAIAPGQAVKVTLQFETAGAVTQQLTSQKRARVLIARRSSPVTVTVGPPVS